MVNVNVNVEFNSNIVTEVERATSRALEESLLYLLAETNKVVPLDRGDLRRSGGIDVDGVSGNIYYDTAYAVKMHENPQFSFKNGRKGKYLESTVNSSIDKIRDYLASELRNVFRG